MPILDDEALRSVRAEVYGRHGGANSMNMTEDWSPEEIEFGSALDRYKRVNGRPFPTVSEVLALLLAIGYRRVAAAGSPLPVDRPPTREERLRARGVRILRRPAAAPA